MSLMRILQFEMCIFMSIFVYALLLIVMYKRTNIELDIDLIKEDMKLTQLKTIKDVVHYSLEEIIKLNKRKKILKFKGKINWEGDLNQMRSI